MDGHQQTFLKVVKATGFEKKNIKFARVVLILLCALNVGLIVSSTVSNHWVESTNFFEYRGLWKYCSNEECYSLDDPVVTNTHINRAFTSKWLQEGIIPTWLTVCRVTIIIAAAFSFFSFCVAVFGLFNRYIYGYYSSIFSLITFACLLTSVYLFSSKTDYDYELVTCGYAWGLGFLSVVLTFLSGFTGFCTF